MVKKNIFVLTSIFALCFSCKSLNNSKDSEDPHSDSTTATVDEEPTDSSGECQIDQEIEKYEMNFVVTSGFDENGAALAIAIDDEKEAALVVGVKFALPFYQGSFEPNCDVEQTIENYNWGRVAEPLQDLVNSYPYIEGVMSDVPGIRTMPDEMVAFLIIKDGEGEKIYVAKKGQITFTREDGPSDRFEGTLSFVEITRPSDQAEVVNNTNAIKIQIIYFEV